MTTKTPRPTVSEWDDRILDRLETEEVDIFGYKLTLLKHERISAKIKEKGIYEAAMTRLLPTMLNVGGNFLDVGANLGYYSLWLARLGLGRSTVHAFEPNPMTYRILKGTVERNGLTEIVVNNLAIGKEGGTLSIDLGLTLPDPAVAASDYNLGGWSLTHKKAGSHEVRVVSIDEYVEERKLQGVKFIKIDVEGFERYVLAGAKDTLRAHKPNIMIELAAPNERRREQIMYILDFLKVRKYNLAYVESRPFPHLRQLRAADIADPTFRFYAFACRMPLDFLGT